MAKKTFWNILMACGVSALVLTGCGAESGVEKVDGVTGTAATGNAVSAGKAVSGSAVDGTGAVHKNALADDWLWGDFSKGFAEGDGYSFSNSTNTYTNDSEEGHGTVCQRVSDGEESETLTLEKEGGENLEVVYATDEALYYSCHFKYDTDLEEYTESELWRVPVRKGEGLDELDFDAEECLFHLDQDMMNVYVMSPLIYVNIAGHTVVEEDISGNKCAVYDEEQKKWISLKKLWETEENLSDPENMFWTGATEEGGILQAETGRKRYDFYLADTAGMKCYPIVKGTDADNIFCHTYNAKAFYLSDGRTVWIYQNKKKSVYLSERDVGEHVSRVLQEWTAEDKIWDYTGYDWGICEMRTSRDGRLYLSLDLFSKSQKRQAEQDTEDGQIYDSYTASLTLSCPLNYQPEASLEETPGQYEYLFYTGCETVHIGRVDWEACKEALSGKKSEELEAFLPVLTEEKEFTLIQWNGKEGALESFPQEKVTLKKYIQEKILQPALEGIGLTDVFQTGEDDLVLWLEDDVLILHREAGQYYGLCSDVLGDAGEITQKGILCLYDLLDPEMDTEEYHYFQVSYPEKKGISGAVMKKAATEVYDDDDEQRFQIGGRDVTGEELEEWIGQELEWVYPEWKQ